MNPFKNSIRYLAIALTLLMPVYPNVELLGEQNKEKIELIENIKNKEDAKKELEKLGKLIREMEDKKNFNKAISYLEKVIYIEKNFYGEYRYLGDAYNWLGEIYLKIYNYFEAEKNFLKVLKIRELNKKENPISLIKSYRQLGKLYLEKGDFNKAEKYLLKSLKKIEKISEDNETEFVMVYMNLGQLYERKYLFKKAKIYYQKSLYFKEKLFGKKNNNLIPSYLNLGRLSLNLGETKKAEKYYLKALNLQKSLLGNNHPSTIFSLIHLSDLYAKNGLFKKEEEYLLKAKNINNIYQNKNDIYYVSFSNKLANIYLRKGLYDEAEQTLLNALEITEDKYDKIKIYLSLSNLYITKSSFNKAEENLLKALKISEDNIEGTNRNLHSIFKKLGHLYSLQGIYEKAEQYYLKSLLLLEKTIGINNKFSADINYSLGYLYERKGLYDEAEQALLRALEITITVYGDNHPELRTIYEHLGDFYLGIGEPYKGEVYFLKSLEITENFFGNNHPYIAEEKGNIGFFYLQQGNYKKAELFLSESLDSYLRHYGENHPFVSDAYKIMGFLYDSQFLSQKAENYYLKSFNINKNLYGENHISNANNLNEIAKLKRNNSNYIDSSLLYKKGIKLQLIHLQKELPYKSIKERNLFSQNIDLNIPYTIYQFALEDELKSEKELAMFLRLNRNGLLEEIEKRQNKLVNSLSDIKIVENIKNLKSQISIKNPEESKNNYLIKKIEKLEKKLFNLLPDLEPKIVEVGTVANLLPKDSVLIELQRFTPQETSFNFTNGMYLYDKEGKILIRSFFLKDSPAEKAGLKKGDHIISINNFSTAGLTYRDVINIFRNIKEEKVNIKIERNNLRKTFTVNRSLKMKSFNLKEDRYLALILDRNENISIKDLGKADELDLLIKNALIASEEGYEDAQNIWDEISSKFFNPLKKYLLNKKIIFISPDSELNRISFSTLRSPKNNQRFINEDYEIRLLTTGRELINLNQNKKSFENSFVIANPDFEKDLNKDSFKIPKIIRNSENRSYDLDNVRWSSLPGTEKEGELISSLINAGLFTGSKATSNLIKNLNNFKILHIASHSYFLNDQENSIKNNNFLSKAKSKEILFGTYKSKENPLLRSGIVLAGANNPKIKDNNDDGYLTALEITNLDWEDTELVVISGCESGLGEIKSGEGVYGLKRSISVAGAKSSLLSLWKVDDIATAAFMKSFYERLKAGEGRADALAATQKEFRNHSIPGWRHPYVWAAFQLSGDWRPIVW